MNNIRKNKKYYEFTLKLEIEKTKQLELVRDIKKIEKSIKEKELYIKRNRTVCFMNDMHRDKSGRSDGSEESDGSDGSEESEESDGSDGSEESEESDGSESEESDGSEESEESDGSESDKSDKNYFAQTFMNMNFTKKMTHDTISLSSIDSDYDFDNEVYIDSKVCINNEVCINNQKY